jgi:hypothetical protein
MSYGDASAIFRLFWDMSDDARLIQSHIPARHELLAGYLYFLETNRHPEATGSVAKSLASLAGADDVSFLMQYCDQAFEFDPAVAVEVWNTMCRRKLLALPELNPDRGAIVGDPQFALFPSPGFGWHVVAPEGVTVGQSGEAHGIRINFSANQPEDCILIYTELPVKPNSRYRIRFNPSFEQNSSIAGLAWEAVAFPSGTPVLAHADFAADSVPGSLDFETHGEALVRLRLHYRRPIGSMRARGAVTFRTVFSELAP